MAATDSALIVGAGPAGLSTAIALRQAGVERVEIVEITDGSGVIGSELALMGPMLRALDALGAADDCAAAGVGISETELCSQDGQVFERQTLPPAHRSGLPPMVGITRPALHAVLSRRALDLGASLRYETSVDSLELSGEESEITFSDGSVGRFGLIVGADGVASQTRSLVLPDAEEPFYVGQAAWRARVPRGDLPPILAAFYGQDAKPGLITVSDEFAYLFCLVTVPEFERLEREQFPELLRRALAPFGGAIAQLRDEIVDPDHIHYSPLTPVIVGPPWHREHAVMIGDATHATTPHLGYGAGLAVEDGVVLGEEIRAQDTVADALAAFTARRYERCRMTVENGVQLSRWEQSPHDPDADHAGLIGASFGALQAQI
jgi:2-polyprenyl-6-methoxyphenol hydroxylase-like FAD-dependent oxidoreductase